jgi:hypothetical protein
MGNDSLMYYSVPEIIDALGFLLKEHRHRTGERNPVLLVGANEWYAIRSWNSHLAKGGWPFSEYKLDGAHIMLVKRESYALVWSMSDRAVKIK